jgi:hypothetical protein
LKEKGPLSRAFFMVRGARPRADQAATVFTVSPARFG